MEFYFSLLISFLFGTFIGSFLNVVILRHNTGKTLLGRSGCMSCRGELRPFELVPVLSWLAQSGRCRRCASRISPQYPLVELGTGVIFALAFLHSTTIFSLIFNILLFCVLLIIFVYDLRHKIIPDRYVWSFVALGVVSMFVDFSDLTIVLPDLLRVLAPLVLAFPFAFFWFISGGTWMGFGDAKLALGIGAVLGLKLGLVSLMYSFWIGAIVSLGIIGVQKLLTLSSRRKQLTMKSEIPFAPFLIISFLLLYLWPEVFLAPFSYLYI